MCAAQPHTIQKQVPERHRAGSKCFSPRQVGKPQTARTRTINTRDDGRFFTRAMDLKTKPRKPLGRRLPLRLPHGPSAAPGGRCPQGRRAWVPRGRACHRCHPGPPAHPIPSSQGTFTSYLRPPLGPKPHDSHVPHSLFISSNRGNVCPSVFVKEKHCNFKSTFSRGKKKKKREVKTGRKGLTGPFPHPCRGVVFEASRSTF